MEEQSEESVLKPRERRDARENRERLLEVAKELFAAQGIDATSMHEIARTAGVGQGTLYRHFPDKGELCHALIKEDISAFRERLGSVIRGTWALESPLARLDTLITEKIRLTESHLSLFAAMETESGSGRARRFRGPFHRWLQEQITELLSEAIERGDIAELDKEFTADAILAAISPPLYSVHRNELGFSSERIIAGMRRLYIEGMRRTEPVADGR